MTRVQELSIESFARQCLAEQLDHFLAELGSSKRRTRPEWIHGTRVHSRRLRAALEAFEDFFPSAPWKGLREQVRAIARGLGNVREQEVSLTILREVTRAGDMAENLAREYLEERLRRKQRKARTALGATIEEVALPRLRTHAALLFGANPPQFEPPRRRARAPSFTLRAARGAALRDAQPTLFESAERPLERARRMLTARAAPILGFQSTHRFNRATDEQLHELRIAAKKLRYLMEIFNPVWPGGLRGVIARARGLQDAGGRYHDWCVVGERIDREIRRAICNEASHLGFQLGRLLHAVAARKIDLRRQMLPALQELESVLRDVLLGALRAELIKKR
jgi:CHAD domain-containing protein